MYWKRKRSTIFLERTREGHRQWDEHWNLGKVGETAEGWSAYGLFRAHRYHLELNWTVNIKLKVMGCLFVSCWTVGLLAGMSVWSVVVGIKHHKFFRRVRNKTPDHKQELWIFQSQVKSNGSRCGRSVRALTCNTNHFDIKEVAALTELRRRRRKRRKKKTKQNRLWVSKVKYICQYRHVPNVIYAAFD